jgi:hypothetical protein
MEQGHFDDGHVERLWKLVNVAGLAGDLSH